MAKQSTPFPIETGIALPPRASGGGGAPSAVAEMLDALAALKIDAAKPPSFLHPAAVDAKAKFKNEDEKAKAETEIQRTIANRLSGAVRRWQKRRDEKAPKVKFECRKVDGGVRVFRTA